MDSSVDAAGARHSNARALMAGSACTEDPGESASIGCDLCGQVRVTVLARLSRSGEPLRTVCCRDCGHVWSDPRPHDPRRFYETDYRVAYKRAPGPLPRRVLRAGRVALLRHEIIADHLDRPQRILDVGSGGGEFAYLLSRLGHRVVGIEPNRVYAEHSSRQYGLDVLRGFVGEVALEPASFDVITIWHVLEHTEHPVAVLASLRRALKPGGLLVVEVPNLVARCQSPANRFHEAHLFSFTLETLAASAAKAGLAELAHLVANDSANITLFCRPAPSVPSTLAMPGHHDRVVAQLRAHTTARHLLTAHPYRRAARRLARSLDEWLSVRSHRDGRAMLDALYAKALERPASGDGVVDGMARSREGLRPT